MICPPGKLAIRHATVTMQDWNAALPRLELQDVNLDVRRGDADLSMVFSAHLPPALGGTLSVSGDARGRSDLQLLNWSALARARGISFSGWRLLLPEYLNRLDAGSGEFDLAASGTGRILASADLDFAAQDVVTQLSDGPSAKFQQISGALSVVHAGDRWTLSGKRVRTVRSGRRDPDSSFDVSWRSTAAGLLDLHARASYLRADSLLPLAGLLPDKEVRNQLRELAPTGEWTDTAIALARSTAADPLRLQVQAKFRDVGFAPVGRAPGLRGLTGSIAGTESGGHVTIDTPTAVFSWPAQFPRPVELDALTTTVYWKRTNEELLVATPDWEMKNRDAGVRLKAAWAEPADGSSPVLTLVSSVENGNVASTHNYFPRGLIAPPALAWLDRAFVAGHLSRAEIVLQGPIRHFPFRDGSGLFLARCALDGVTLDYGEGWPRLENLAAQAEFRNEGMSGHLISGKVGGIPVGSADARFPDFKTGELEIHVGAGGDAADALAFLSATPLNDMAEHAFSSVEAKGPMRFTVDLFLPFKDFVHRRILVHGQLEGVTLNRPGFERDGERIERRFRHRRCTSGARRRSRPRSRRPVPNAGPSIAQPSADPNPTRVSRYLERRGLARGPWLAGRLGRRRPDRMAGRLENGARAQSRAQPACEQHSGRSGVEGAGAVGQGRGHPDAVLVRNPMAGDGRSARAAVAGIRGERFLCPRIRRERIAARAFDLEFRRRRVDFEQRANIGRGRIGRAPRSRGLAQVEPRR